MSRVPVTRSVDATHRVRRRFIIRRPTRVLGWRTGRRRDPMNSATVAIRCRHAAFRRQATTAARRIGVVEVDHGEADGNPPVSADSIETAWKRSESNRLASPAAQERVRESTRKRC